MRANLKPVECGVRVRRIVRQSVIAVRVVEHARKPGNERVRLHEESAGLGGKPLQRCIGAFAVLRGRDILVRAG